jgi:hypothetical protein
MTTTEPAPAKMTSRDVLTALHGRWPDSEYLKVEEAPEDSHRQGRKIDLLVVSLWASRGHELDAVEVKVSMSDYRRELKEAAKADWWFHHSNRFWVAVPADIAAAARKELPEPWGLISVMPDGKTKAVVKAPKHPRQDFGWQSTIGLLRASANAGANALFRAEEHGRRIGHERGLEEGKRTASPGGHQTREVERLTGIITRFEEASGLAMDHDPERLGELVAIIQAWQRDPEGVASKIERAATGAAQAAATLTEIAKDWRATAKP